MTFYYQVNIINKYNYKCLKRCLFAYVKTVFTYVSVIVGQLQTHKFDVRQFCCCEHVTVHDIQALSRRIFQARVNCTTRVKCLTHEVR